MITNDCFETNTFDYIQNLMWVYEEALDNKAHEEMHGLGIAQT